MLRHIQSLRDLREPQRLKRKLIKPASVKRPCLHYYRVQMPRQQVVMVGRSPSPALRLLLDLGCVGLLNDFSSNRPEKKLPVRSFLTVQRIGSSCCRNQTLRTNTTCPMILRSMKRTLSRTKETTRKLNHRSPLSHLQSRSARNHNLFAIPTLQLSILDNNDAGDGCNECGECKGGRASSTREVRTT